MHPPNSSSAVLRPAQDNFLGAGTLSFGNYLSNLEIFPDDSGTQPQKVPSIQTKLSANSTSN